jgi:hypothetical protein
LLLLLLLLVLVLVEMVVPLLRHIALRWIAYCITAGAVVVLVVVLLLSHILL